MKTMHTTTQKEDKPMIIRGREMRGAGGPIRTAERCGPWGGKGRNGRRERERRAIDEQRR